MEYAPYQRFLVYSSSVQIRQKLPLVKIFESSRHKGWRHGVGTERGVHRAAGCRRFRGSQRKGMIPSREHGPRIQWGHYPSELEAEQSNQTPELFCISVAILGKNSSFAALRSILVECLSEIFVWFSLALS